MRVKTGIVRRRKHKKLLARTKGMRMTKGKLIKVSKEADLHAGQYAYIGRKEKKRNFRKLWIIRINAFCHENGYKYNQLIKALSDKKIELDRKILAKLALEQPDDMKTLCQTALK